jgi:hypothetical protein
VVDEHCHGPNARPKRGLRCELRCSAGGLLGGCAYGLLRGQPRSPSDLTSRLGLRREGRRGSGRSDRASGGLAHGERGSAETTELSAGVARATAAAADAHFGRRRRRKGGDRDDARRRDCSLGGNRRRDRHRHRPEAVAARHAKANPRVVPRATSSARGADHSGRGGGSRARGEVEARRLRTCDRRATGRGSRVADHGRTERIRGGQRGWVVGGGLRRSQRRRSARRGEHGGRSCRSDPRGEALAALLAEHEVPWIVPPARCADHALRMGHPRRPRRQAGRSNSLILMPAYRASPRVRCPRLLVWFSPAY